MRSTALKKYQKLESSGLWREAPELQRREVVVAFGEASLTLSDPRTEAALSHWSLPAVERINPGELPALYAQNRDHYRRRNDHYVFANYLEVFRRYALRAKDPVPHPLMPGGEVASQERAEYIPTRTQPAE
mgnify:CR=1 FL=1